MTTYNDDGTFEFLGKTYGTVVSPYTGKIWLDRNLGATQVCTTINDGYCYGDYYQWGRSNDGHEYQYSDEQDSASLTISSSNNNFIKRKADSGYESVIDWLADDIDDNGFIRSKNWSSSEGTSICPIGFRVPTYQELVNETSNEGVERSIDAFNSFLKIPAAGYRSGVYGNLNYRGEWTSLWSSDPYSTAEAKKLFFKDDDDFFWYFAYSGRVNGSPIRCIQGE